MSITPAEFLRRLYTQLEKGKGMRLSPEEMDLLAEMGAIEAVSKFAADWIRKQAQERLAASRGLPGSAVSRSTGDQELTAYEAGLRALEMSRPKKDPSRSYLSQETAEEAMRRALSRTKPKGSHK